MAVNYLVHRCLLTSFEYGNYQSKWLSEIKRILDSTGFTHIWANHTEADLSPAWIGEAIKQRHKDQFIQKWMADLNMSSKCINYRAFRVTFLFENYLVELPQRISVPLCKFRLTNYKLLKQDDKTAHLEVNDFVYFVMTAV
jgi:hypothetical protein